MESNEIEILLVEDNPYDVELTLNALRRRNLANHVVVANDGAEALDMLLCEGRFAGQAPHYPRVVLLDLKLPRIDGLEVLRRLKSYERTRTIPIVVLTSSREEWDVVESYRLGVNSYIVKPVDFENFFEAISTLGLYWLVLNEPPDNVRRGTRPPAP